MPPEEPAHAPSGSPGRRHRRTRRRWKERLSRLRRLWPLGWLLLAAGLTWAAVWLLDRL